MAEGSIVGICPVFKGSLRSGRLGLCTVWRRMVPSKMSVSGAMPKLGGWHRAYDASDGIWGTMMNEAIC